MKVKDKAWFKRYKKRNRKLCAAVKTATSEADVDYAVLLGTLQVRYDASCARMLMGLAEKHKHTPEERLRAHQIAKKLLLASIDGINENIKADRKEIKAKRKVKRK